MCIDVPFRRRWPPPPLRREGNHSWYRLFKFYLSCAPAFYWFSFEFLFLGAVHGCVKLRDGRGSLQVRANKGRGQNADLNRSGGNAERPEISAADVECRVSRIFVEEGVWGGGHFGSGPA